MGRYRKRPLVVDAIQFTGHNIAEIAELLDWSYEDGSEASDSCDTLVVETLEGDMTANVGDWIVKGVAGEGYPCRADIFAAIYEPVDHEEA
jgi:hypothetical protein